MKEQEVIKRLNFHKEYVRLYSSRVVMISETDLETVLNMLKEKDKEIEELKQALARNIAKNFTSSMKESEKSKEDLEMLNRGWQIELERKDKIIDLIARAFKQDDVRTVEEIKKYFERKSEEC